MKDTRASGVNRIDVALIGEAEGRSDTATEAFRVASDSGARFAHAALSRKNSYGRSKWAKSI